MTATRVVFRLIATSLASNARLWALPSRVRLAWAVITVELGLVTVADSVAAPGRWRWAVVAGLPGLIAVADAIAAAGLRRRAIRGATLIRLSIVADTVAAIRT